jgi:hypothetical protein
MDAMTNYPKPDKAREGALEAAVRDLAEAVTPEDLAAAMEAVRQIPIDRERMLNALRVPEDTGEYEAALRALLERIPDGWGRWIACGSDWFPILARLEERLNELDPDYQVNQIKEKFGTLYWEGDIPNGDALVAEAEAESARTCELCGSQGNLRTKAGWLKTLCDACATTKEYSDLPAKR